MPAGTLSSFIMRRSTRTMLALALFACPPMVAGEDAEALLRAGVANFERGDVLASAKSFDALIALQPEIRPGLWQRGISLYYAKRLEDCVDQFVAHRTVNPDDAENAIWHYLCVAATRGEQEARDGLFPAQDSRIPLMAIHRLYAGAGSVDQVFAAVEASSPAPRDARVHAFYAHLYVALWYESHGDAKNARQQLERSLDGPPIGHYMERVARVHLDRIRSGRHWVGVEAKTSDPASERP